MNAILSIKPHISIIGFLNINLKVQSGYSLRYHKQDEQWLSVMTIYLYNENIAKIF